VLCHAKVSRASDGSASPEGADNGIVQTRKYPAVNRPFPNALRNNAFLRQPARGKYCLPLYNVVYECILELF
jgi:hypothetical protein